MHVHTSTVEIEGKTFTITELTLGEIRSLFKRMTELEAGGSFDVVDFGLFPEIDLVTVGRMANIEDMDVLTPSQLKVVIEKCRQVNPDFFRMRDRLMTAGRQIQEARATTWSDPSHC
ncbi:MAG: hypothetical protein HQL64_15495 [Magnetococcales bacterium]|nr:hypothetical protein [Magnetococcales bacterium]